MSDIAVELKNITKSFGNVVANKDVNLVVEKGTIHGLLGENGSGKSTLMKVLFGLHKRTAGQIFVNGKEVFFESPLEAIRNGIGMIQQEFMLLPNLTVRENLLAAVWNKKPKAKSSDLIEEGKDILKKLALEDSLDEKINQLSVGEQQKVEIAKTLYQGAEIIILDEPTSVLTPQESLELFHILKELKKQGKTIILITHKLDEVLNYCSKVSVLRAGKLVSSFETKGVDKYTLAEKMVGKKVLFQLTEKKEIKNREYVHVENISYKNKQGIYKLKDVEFSIREGEILGVAGIDGNGQRELANVLAGVLKPGKGTYILNGTKVEKFSPKFLENQGVSFIPEQRNNVGAVNDLSIEKNLILKNYFKKTISSFGVINNKKVKENSEKLISEYGIKATSGKVKAGTLSGGNLQKVILARELSKNPKFLICAQPTRGLDIGAVESVSNLLIEARNKGISILLISTELDEILSLSDRVAVIYEGKIVDIVENNSKIDIGEIGLMMAGGKNPNNYVAGGSNI